MNHIILTSMPNADLAKKWNALLADTQFATHYVTPNYFIDPYVLGQRFAVLAVEDDGRIAASATGTFDDKHIVSGLFSRPQMIFRNGINREAAINVLLDGMRQLCESPRSISLYAWQEMQEFIDHGMQMRPSNDETSVVMVDLSAGPDAIFANFSQTRRNEIRKALKQANIEIKEVETASELAELYKISCDWNARKGSPGDSFGRMQAAALQRENRRIFIAKTEGKVIAGSFYRFTDGGVVEYAANFSMPEHQKLRPNDLIGWHAIQWACSKGFSHFSMGGSHLFLRRFGGEILKTYRYKWDDGKFHMNDIRVRTREFGVDAYRRLPEKIRTGVRKVFAE